MPDIPLHGGPRSGRRGPPPAKGPDGERVVDPGKNVVPPQQPGEPSPVPSPDKPTPKEPPPEESG